MQVGLNPIIQVVSVRLFPYPGYACLSRGVVFACALGTLGLLLAQLRRCGSDLGAALAPALLPLFLHAIRASCCSAPHWLNRVRQPAAACGRSLRSLISLLQ